MAPSQNYQELIFLFVWELNVHNHLIVPAGLSANNEQLAGAVLSRWSRGNTFLHLATPQVLARKYNNFSAV
jgi:hypothetical protein